MLVFHRHWNPFVFVNSHDFSPPLLVLLHTFAVQVWTNEAKSVHSGAVAFNVTAKQGVILSQPITDCHHILRNEAIEAYIDVQKCQVFHESLAPLPG